MMGLNFWTACEKTATHTYEINFDYHSKFRTHSESVLTLETFAKRQSHIEAVLSVLQSRKAQIDCTSLKPLFLHETEELLRGKCTTL